MRVLFCGDSAGELFPPCSGVLVWKFGLSFLFLLCGASRGQHSSQSLAGAGVCFISPVQMQAGIKSTSDF